MIVALILQMAPVPVADAVLLKHAQAFARSAMVGGHLANASKDIRFRNLFDMRDHTSGNELTVQQFMDDVAGCPVASVSTTAVGAFVELSCPDDAAHGGGAVSYNLSFDGGAVSEVSLQIGRISVLRTPTTRSAY